MVYDDKWPIFKLAAGIQVPTMLDTLYDVDGTIHKVTFYLYNIIILFYFKKKIYYI